MANIATLLKSEISRLARKGIRGQVAPVRKSLAAHRRDIAKFKRLLAEANARLGQLAKAQSNSGEGSVEAPKTKTRFVAKGLRSLRKRLGLSASELAKLISVSQQSVYNWETKKAVPRAEQLKALSSLRGIGKREAKARLEGLANADGSPGRKRKRK